MPKKRRKKKVVALEEALGRVPNGACLGIGGHVRENRPAAFLRALLRRGVKDLTVMTSPSAGFEVDLLVGAGAVRTLYAGYVGFEHLGLAPNFRWAAETGKVEVIAGEEATLLGGFLARAEGVPYHPVGSLLGTDFLRLDPDLKRFTAEDGEEVWMVPALGPEVSVVHAQEADEYGNLRYLGSPFADPILVRASNRVVATVDRIVSNRRFRAAPDRTTIQGFRVGCVVEMPFGAHPCGSQGVHVEDEAHLRTYIEAGRAERKGTSPGAFEAYLRRYVYEPRTHEEYLERVGGEDRLAALRAAVRGNGR